MDWELESGGTHFPTTTTAPPEAGVNILLFFLVLGLIWLAVKICEWLRARATMYYSADSVRQRQERREELARIELERRERAERRRRDQRDRQAERERAAQEQHRKRGAIAKLAVWHAEQRRQIEAVVPAGPEREVLLGELYGRYDALLKRAIEELQP